MIYERTTLFFQTRNWTNQSNKDLFLSWNTVYTSWNIIPSKYLSYLWEAQNCDSLGCLRLLPVFGPRLFLPILLRIISLAFCRNSNNFSNLSRIFSIFIYLNKSYILCVFIPRIAEYSSFLILGDQGAVKNGQGSPWEAILNKTIPQLNSNACLWLGSNYPDPTHLTLSLQGCSFLFFPGLCSFPSNHF